MFPLYYSVKVKMLVPQSIQLFVAPWTVARQGPLSMGSSRQKHWSGLLCSPLEDLPDPGIEPMSLMSLALAGGFFTTGATWEVHVDIQLFQYPNGEM